MKINNLSSNDQEHNRVETNETLPEEEDHNSKESKENHNTDRAAHSLPVSNDSSNTNQHNNSLIKFVYTNNNSQVWLSSNANEAPKDNRGNQDLLKFSYVNNGGAVYLVIDEQDPVNGRPNLNQSMDHEYNTRRAQEGQYIHEPNQEVYIPRHPNSNLSQYDWDIMSDSLYETVKTKDDDGNVDRYAMQEKLHQISKPYTEANGEYSSHFNDNGLHIAHLFAAGVSPDKASNDSEVARDLWDFQLSRDGGYTREHMYNRLQEKGYSYEAISRVEQNLGYDRIAIHHEGGMAFKQSVETHLKIAENNHDAFANANFSIAILRDPRVDHNDALGHLNQLSELGLQAGLNENKPTLVVVPYSLNHIYSTLEKTLKKPDANEPERGLDYFSTGYTPWYDDNMTDKKFMANVLNKDTRGGWEFISEHAHGFMDGEVITYLGESISSSDYRLHAFLGNTIAPDAEKARLFLQSCSCFYAGREDSTAAIRGRNMALFAPEGTEIQVYGAPDVAWIPQGSDDRSRYRMRFGPSGELHVDGTLPNSYGTKLVSTTFGKAPINQDHINHRNNYYYDEYGVARLMDKIIRTQTASNKNGYQFNIVGNDNARKQNSYRFRVVS